MPRQSIEQKIIALLERKENEIERTLRLLYGVLPAWFPLPRLESAERIIHRLVQADFSAEQIAEFVAYEMSGYELYYLLAHPKVARQDINELAHIKYALSLPDSECLEMLAGALAAFAVPFKKHSGKLKKPGPIRKRIAIELKKNPELMPRQLWAILTSKPPKGWEFFDNRAGKDITGPKGGDGMGYARFSEVCKEEKDKLNT